MYQRIQVVLKNNHSINEITGSIEDFNDLTKSIWRIFLESFQNSPTHDDAEIVSIDVNTFEPTQVLDEKNVSIFDKQGNKLFEWRTDKNM
jgi:hypothetical protein